MFQRPLLWKLVVCVLMAVVIVGVYEWLRVPSIEARFLQARSAFVAENYSQSLELAQQLNDQQPGQASVLHLLAMTERQRGNVDAAILYYHQLAEISHQRPASTDSLGPFAMNPPEMAQAMLGAGNFAIQRGRFLDAEAFWRASLAAVPGQAEPINRLAYLLGVEGRCLEARPLLRASLLHRGGNRVHAILLGAVSPVVADQRLVAQCVAAQPNEPLILMGGAREDLFNGQPERASTVLKRVAEQYPHLVEASALYGQALFEIDPDAIVAWNRQLPPEAEQHPIVWYVRGRWAARADQREAALQAMATAVRLDPTFSTASHQLASQLEQHDRSDAAGLFRQRATLLNRLGTAVNVLYDDPQNVERLAEAMSITHELLRFAESRFWAAQLLSLKPQHAAALKVLGETRTPGPAFSEDRLRPAELAALDALAAGPDIQWPTSPQISSPENGSLAAALPVSLTDQAPAAGIDFRYFAGQGPRPGTQSILQQPGGGVGVLDFDNDGWPDIYFTQGGPIPPVAESDQYRDVLYRNRGDGTFARVEQSAGLGDGAYSHGCAAGDYNSDGFADLHVANAGDNRLYRNNGDGTFTDVSSSIQATPPTWTSSCVIADLNEDGLADILEINYLDVSLQHPSYCTSEGGVCGPPHFSGVADRLLLNQGDGSFEDISDRAGLGELGPRGKGLGVLVTRLNADSELSVFIANDTVENFHLVRQTAAGESPVFVDQAILDGLAVDDNGFSQACMGIAAGDVDHDGRTDLFVTNFEAESNTLYQQTGAGLFQDATAAFQLRHPSIPFVGFGTQFLDLNLDGQLDILVANGHAFDTFGFADEPPRAMRPQAFLGLDNGTFQELRSSVASDWLNTPVRGRAMAKLDWNRDGLDDAVISEIDTPAALVTNTTRSAGNWIAFSLQGVTSHRDAIGTRITLSLPGHRASAVLSAGDGYQASNERRIRFGLGEQTQIDSVQLTWPSGATASFTDLKVNRHYQLVESQEPFELPTVPPSRP